MIYRGPSDSAKPVRSATRSALIRYVVALAVLGGMTTTSFLLVRSLISHVKYTETLVAEAADLRSSIHKTMLAIDTVEAGGTEQAVMAAKAEGEVLRSSTDRLLRLLSEAGVSESIWSVVRGTDTGLEQNVRMLIESAAATRTAMSTKVHMPEHGMDTPIDPPHASANGMADDGGSLSMGGGHNPAAMKAIDDLIGKLRAESRREQDHTAFVHDALGYGTLLLLVVEALIVFRPLLRTAASEGQRADHATNELEYLATHDALTGLLNRGQIDRVLQVAVKEAASVKQQLGLILLDMDEFKPINDTFGHAAGDALLTAVAHRIQAALRPGDLCGRLGGDEFIVILPHVRHEPDIQTIANAILSSLAEPILFDGVEISARASVGYAMFPIAGSNVDALMSAADLAMYDAKRQGRGRVSEFSHQMRTEAERSRTVEASLQAAFSNREFELHYQTIHGGQKSSPMAVEALVRWRHPDRGILAPVDFLNDVRRTGRMGGLTSFVLSEAVAQYAVWRAAGFQLNAIHVNIGEEFLHDRTAQAATLQLLAAHGVQARELVLEVTEDVRFEDNSVQASLSYLSDAGITVAVDDFGVGAISIGDLNHSALKMVKLDRAVVQAASSDAKGAAVLSSLVDLLRALGKDVVAEGVETEQHQAIVGSLGIEMSQGYLFSRPQRAARVTEALAQKRNRPMPDNNVAA